MYLKLNKQFRHGSNNLGVFFENSTISYTSTSFLVPSTPVATLPVTIVDTIYNSFSFLYTASGSETDFMIGGYMPYSSANYPLIFPGNPNNGSFFVYDDFSMIPTNIDLGTDISICLENDSVLIGEANWAETNYKWYANGALIDTIHGQIKIKPSISTTYVVQKITDCAITQDTLIVSFNGTCPDTTTTTKELIIPTVFTPNLDGVNDVWRFSIKGASSLNCSVYNRWGNLIYELGSRPSATEIIWDGRTTSGEPCNEGVYFYTLKYTDITGEQQSRNGYVSLFR